MAKNTSIEGRFSLNTTHLPLPIAESTCLNLNGHSWVAAPLSPQHRSNSNGCLIQTPKSTTRLAAENIGRIDARTYTDVQSNGLTSRIVQYHNKSGSRLNRSTSMNALYPRPGQFPVVHLKKTEVPISASKRNQLSMTRIAPPEKSLFYGNTLSGLLRSNSIVGENQKNDRKISHENRPIIHPPPTEDDSMPTRSVLDVLKEISRKRINSEDDEGRMEATMKKYCNRETQEQVDSTTTILTNQQQQQLQQQQQNWQRTQFNNYKRPREHKSLAHSPNSNIRHTPPTQTSTSPEQAAKSRRLSNFNNDITSSLSSSQIYANKRKLYDSPQGKKQSTDEQEISAQRYKVKRQQFSNDIVARSMSSNAIGSSYSPIIPLPSTPQTNNINNTINRNDVRNVDGVPAMRTMSTPICAYKDVSKTPIKSKPRVTLFNKNYEVEEKTINNHNNRDLNISNGSNNENSYVDEEENDNSYAKIQFVKPKKGEVLSGNKHPLIQRTQKSKLALMLCGLRGELYQGGEVSPPSTPAPIAAAASSSAIDELDTHKTSITTTTTKTNMEEKKNDMTSISSTIGTPPTPTNTTNAEISEKQQQQQTELNKIPSSNFTGFQITPTPTATTTKPAIETTPVAAASIMPIKKTTSPLVGIKLTPAKTMESITPISKDSNATTITTAPSALGNINPSTGAFQFGVPTTTSMPTLKLGTGTFNFGNNNNATPTTTIEQKKSETVLPTNSGLSQATTFAAFSMANNIKATTNTIQTAAAVMPFNMPNSNAGATTTTIVATFSTTQPTLTNTTTVTTGEAAIATSSPSFFAFGNQKTSSNTSTTTTTPAPAPAPAPTLFAFGVSSGGGGVEVAQTTVTTNTTGGFSFANSIANGTKPTASAAPFLLNNSTSKIADNNNSNNTGSATLGGFSFSNNNNNNNSGFAFGSASIFATNTNNTTNATPSLGFNTNAVNSPVPSSTASSSMPTFNLFNNQATVSATTSATMQTAAKPVFAFGNTAIATTTSNNSTTTTNLFAAAASMNNNNDKSNTQGVVKPNFGFGNNTTNNTNESKPATASSTFNFGTSANAAPSKTFTFGSTTSNNNNNSAPNIFGTAGTATTSTPTFGSTSTNNNTSPNIFGTAGTATTSIPTFGSTSTNNNTSPNIFGTAGTATTSTPTFGSISTNTNKSSAPNIFGTAGTTSTSTPTFGSVGQSSNVSTVAPFNLDNAAKPFSFGSGASINQNNVFGGAGAMPAAGTTMPMFNFSNTTANKAPASTPTMNNNTNNNNMFSPAPSNDRPIRRATRRLNK